MPDSDEPVSATALYARHAEAFAEATALDDDSGELLALLDSFVAALPGPQIGRAHV